MKTITLAALLLLSQPILAAEKNDKLQQLEQLLTSQQAQIQALQKQLESNQKIFEALQQQVSSNTKSSQQANNKTEILVENMESRSAIREKSKNSDHYI